MTNVKEEGNKREITIDVEYEAIHYRDDNMKKVAFLLSSCHPFIFSSCLPPLRCAS